MLTRRELIGRTSLAAAALVTPAGLLDALEHAVPITGTIPKTAETLPIVGLGTAASFRAMSRTDDTAALREVIRTLVDNGGTVLDTAPSYARAKPSPANSRENSG